MNLKGCHHISHSPLDTGRKKKWERKKFAKDIEWKKKSVLNNNKKENSYS